MLGFPVHHQLLELVKLMSIESAMPSNHLILCDPSIMGTQREEGQTQGGRWSSEKNGESEKGVQSRKLMAGE